MGWLAGFAPAGFSPDLPLFAEIVIVEQSHPCEQIIEDMRAAIVRTHAITRTRKTVVLSSML